MKYVDCDGDNIAVSSQIEWEEMISVLSEKSYKISIEIEKEKSEENTNEETEEPNGCPFGGSGRFKGCSRFGRRRDRDRNFPRFGRRFRGCPMSGRYEENRENNECNEEKEESNGCPFGGSGRFKGCPRYGRFRGNGGCPRFGNRENFGKRRFWKLHRMSIQCLESKDPVYIQKGKEILLQMLEIKPNHMIALYNLACAESLLGNVNEAIVTLERAIDAGYADLFHMLNDSDFNNIKNSDGFNNLVKKLEKGLFPEKESTKTEDQNVKDNNEEKQDIKKEEDPMENVLDTLEQIYQFPRDVLKDLLIQCKGSIEEVANLISSFN